MHYVHLKDTEVIPEKLYESGMLGEACAKTMTMAKVGGAIRFQARARSIGIS